VGQCSASILNSADKATKQRGTPGLVRMEMNMADQLRSFLRLKQVKALTGMSRSWLYEAIRRGEFPAPIPLGARAVAWDSAAVADWQESRIHLGRKAAA
jgi:prophage regulatory protein